MNLAAVDLNLLLVLHTVLTEGSATRAAARLHVTQSAVSNSLARLRRLLANPLVVDFTAHDAALGIDSETTLVTGTHAIEPDGAIVIRPSQPTWAARRPLRVQFAAIADGHLITTRIGGPASA